MEVQSTSYSVVILTAYHSISGELSLHDQRFSDFLNDRRDTTVNLRDAQVARLVEPGKVLQRHSEASIAKACILLAFEPRQQAISAAGRLYGFVKKQTHEVFLVLDNMEVRGTLHTTGPLDLRRTLATAGESFLPLTKAVIRLCTNDRYLIEQDAVMVNAHLIRYIAKIEL